MRRKPALWVATLSVLSTSAFGTVVAHADTVSQTTLQSLYSNQSQSANTDTQAGIKQSEQSHLSSDSSLTTQTKSGDTSVQYVDQSNTNTTVDHTVSGTASSTQAQANQSNSNMTQGNAPTTLKIQAHASAKSSQTGSAQTSGPSTLAQSSTSVMLGGQLQTVQEQSGPAAPLFYTHQQTVNIPIPAAQTGPYLTLAQPLDGNTTVAGYAVFDAMGYSMSDKFGGSNTAVSNNNGVDHFHSMQPQQLNEVVIAAVNTKGEPVVNTTPTTVYLTTNNSSGSFLDESSKQTIESVVLPAGVTGMSVYYENNGSVSGYDILDATTTNPFPTVVTTRVYKSYSTATVLATSQTQSMATPASGDTNSTTNITPVNSTSADSTSTNSTSATTGTSLTESQQVVVKTDNQQAPAVDTQTATITQDATASQSQQAVVPTSTTTNDANIPPAGGSQTDGTSNTQTTPTPSNTLKENQSATISSQLQATNQSLTTGGTPSVTVTQSESAASTKDVQMSQSQSVTAQAPVIDFGVTQTASQTNSGTTLSESITASAQVDTLTGGGTTVNVTVNHQDHQVFVPTSGPVTLTESESLNTPSSSTDASQGSSTTTQGSQTTPSDTTPPVQESVTLSYQDGTGKTVVMSV